MSKVTNIILSFSILENEEETIEEINKFFGGSVGLIWIDDKSLPDAWYGGGKGFEIIVLLGAFNYLDFDSFYNHLNSRVSWKDRACVQVFVAQHEENKFRILSLSSD